MFFDRGTFLVLPLTYFYLPKSARAYLFPQSFKMNYFCCSGPISVDPICPQPKGAAAADEAVQAYVEEALARVIGLSTEATFGRGDLSVCPFAVFTGPQE